MKQALLDAALLHYSVHGYQGATMRKIADEVGIKPASIYFFYENKEALFIAAFQQLLDNHFNEMKRIYQEHAEEPVEKIFSALLHGIVSYHTRDEKGTNAYISLVTSPIPGINTHLENHMSHFNDWLVETLKSALKRSYPSISHEKVERTVNQYDIIANGIFWGINLYKGEQFKEQIELADRMIQTIFSELKEEFSEDFN
ncbi:MAG TPA: TetR/AcrR family transcriptional regulator [Bacillaceae bacterium]